MSLPRLPDAQTYAACRQIVEHSAHLTDHRNFEAYAELFTQNGQLTRPGGAPLTGQTAIVESYRSRPAERMTRHMLGQSVMTQQGEGKVQVVTSVLLWSTTTSQTVEAFGRKADARQVLGEYSDDMVLTPEGWRIEKRQSSFVMYQE
ncbi:nuclear transport factor 2 family protein [Pusillimonas sp. CC-YST705]|uniref:Nuclear transport factor 2 family protein n=1 Tax=Mesopusillimonas faecipullorum TaxID=2755040 RepID=A0ABS8CDY1_9BURK|nr:nuclear transport factor 2 family protein [Mesopusillimonas faecipullorum]MCB5364241.1 nuclear transport factor 2 family protein [Mesopusillimonas faecipullorum]